MSNPQKTDSHVCCSALGQEVDARMHSGGCKKERGKNCGPLSVDSAGPLMKEINGGQLIDDLNAR